MRHIKVPFGLIFKVPCGRQGQGTLRLTDTYAEVGGKNTQGKCPGKVQVASGGLSRRPEGEMLRKEFEKKIGKAGRDVGRYFILANQMTVNEVMH